MLRSIPRKTSRRRPPCKKVLHSFSTTMCAPPRASSCVMGIRKAWDCTRRPRGCQRMDSEAFREVAWLLASLQAGVARAQIAGQIAHRPHRPRGRVLLAMIGLRLAADGHALGLITNRLGFARANGQATVDRVVGLPWIVGRARERAVGGGPAGAAQCPERSANG